MSDGDPEKGLGRGVLSAEDREAFKSRAGEIDRRLSEAKARYAPKPDLRQRGQAMGQGLKIAVELVVGVGFGAIVGWWLDDVLGTRPWLMIVMVLLGFGAGMLNIIRTAQRLQAQAEAAQMAAPSVRDADRDEE
jgi:ATP synthase protein I